MKGTSSRRLIGVAALVIATAVAAGAVSRASTREPASRADLARQGENTFSGTWHAARWGGNMVLTQSGGSLRGSFDWSGGGSYNATSQGVGKRWKGTWSGNRADLKGPWIWEVALSADGRTLTQYDYSFGRKDPLVSTAVCTAGACLRKPPPVVEIATVSNGCGGEGSTQQIQQWFGNTSSFRDGGLYSLSFTVSWVDACNLHDAGYAGAIVRDKLNGRIVDYRNWTRKQVDDKFLADLQLLCRRQISIVRKTALARCLSRGGPASYGARWLYDFVREHGADYFDADLDKPGTQKTGPRDNI